MSDLAFTVDGHVAHVRLNRPQGLNAITPAMDQALLDAWTEINANPEIWAVILSAEGEKAFCIGADVSGGTDRSGRMALGGGLTGIGGPLVKLKKPMVAAVQGFCVGGGFELAMCADIIVAADTAQFGLPETKVGIIGECGVVHRAIRQLPYHIAMAMILTGERIKADAALQYGLVNEVVPVGQQVEVALKMAREMAEFSPLVLKTLKRFVTEGVLPHGPSEQSGRAQRQLMEVKESEDAVEATAAVKEKRRAVYKGR